MGEQREREREQRKADYAGGQDRADDSVFHRRPPPLAGSTPD